MTATDPTKSAESRDPTPAAPADLDRATSDLPTITAQSPPYRSPMGSPEPKGRAAHVLEEDRAAFHDFEVLRILGEGSFGKVYLARQISLDRQVALKVTANRGSEARTL